MYVVTNAVSGSWTACSDAPPISEYYDVSGVLFAMKALVDPTSPANTLYLSGSLRAPAIGKFLQLKDATGTLFFTDRQEVSEGVFKPATPTILSSPLTVKLPIYYFQSSGNTATITIFGKPSK